MRACSACVLVLVPVHLVKPFNSFALGRRAYRFVTSGIFLFSSMPFSLPVRFLGCLARGEREIFLRSRSVAATSSSVCLVVRLSFEVGAGGLCSPAGKSPAAWPFAVGGRSRRFAARFTPTVASSRTSSAERAALVNRAPFRPGGSSGPL